VTQEPQRDTGASRRRVLAGAGLVGLAGAATACGAAGSSSSSSSSAGTSTGAAGVTAAPAGTPGAASSASPLTSTSDIPVGGGMIFTSEKVVVTQPESGDFKAFSAVCTHMGCLVATISNGTIDCPCHGSQYSITTGAVVAGPAPKPLPAEPIKVSGTSIFLG
jgi:Rieske Fe-S protein